MAGVPLELEPCPHDGPEPRVSTTANSTTVSVAFACDSTRRLMLFVSHFVASSFGRCGRSRGVDHLLRVLAVRQVLHLQVRLEPVCWRPSSAPARLPTSEVRVRGPRPRGGGGRAVTSSPRTLSVGRRSKRPTPSGRVAGRRRCEALTFFDQLIAVVHPTMSATRPRRGVLLHGRAWDEHAANSLSPTYEQARPITVASSETFPSVLGA